MLHAVGGDHFRRVPITKQPSRQAPPPKSQSQSSYAQIRLSTPQYKADKRTATNVCQRQAPPCDRPAHAPCALLSCDSWHVTRDAVPCGPCYDASSPRQRAHEETQIAERKHFKLGLSWDHQWDSDLYIQAQGSFACLFLPTASCNANTHSSA